MFYIRRQESTLAAIATAFVFAMPPYVMAEPNEEHQSGAETHRVANEIHHSASESRHTAGDLHSFHDNVSGVWKGRFRHPEWDFGVDMALHMSRDYSVQGCITWTLQRAEATVAARKLGWKAAEYVFGTYDPSTRALILDGSVMDDPHDLQIALDSHDLHLTPNGDAIVGHSGLHSDGHDYFKVVRSNRTEQEPIVIKTTFKTTPERLWKYWTDPAYLKTWLCKQAKVGTKTGEPYELFWDLQHPEHNSTKGCIITALAENEYLAFNWRGPLKFAVLMNTDPPPTFVTVSFKKVGNNQTAVSLRHAGWGASGSWEEARAWQQKAWETAFSELRDRVEER